MKDLIKKGLALGLGLAVMSKEQVEKVVDELVKKGEVSAGESKDLVNDLMQRGKEEQQELQNLIKEQVSKFLSELNIPTKKDLEQIEQRMDKLENRS